mgnify:CR=1 FL=1
MYDKTFSLVSFGLILIQFVVFLMPYWKVNDKKDLIAEGFEAFEGLWFRCYKAKKNSLLRT